MERLLRSGGNPLRDFRLKSPDDPQMRRSTPPGEDPGPTHESPFHGRRSFSKTVEERHTVRDGQVNEETTVIWSWSGPDYEGGPRPVHREPLFEKMTHDDDDDDDDEDEDGFLYDGLEEQQQDPVDSAWRSTPPGEDPGPTHESPFHGRRPFSKFGDILRPRVPENERKEHQDLDSAVSAGGMDQIVAPPADPTPQQPRSRTFFQSVTVTKVVKPDGTVEERHTVRDGQVNEETTVTRSGPDHEGEPRPVSDLPRPFSDMMNDSLFSKFFGGFK